jgi:hypothetical protein
VSVLPRAVAQRSESVILAMNHHRHAIAAKGSYDRQTHHRIGVAAAWIERPGCVKRKPAPHEHPD